MTDYKKKQESSTNETDFLFVIKSNPNQSISIEYSLWPKHGKSSLPDMAPT